MSVRKYIANKDTTITNAFGEVFDNRLTGSNAGLADSIEVFSLFGQFTSSAAGNEKSRALLQFPIINIQSDIDNSVIESGSNYILRLFSAETPETPPTNFTLVIAPISSSWDEGNGPELSSKDYTGSANWNESKPGAAWDTAGGDYYSTPLYTASFVTGYENLEVDITPLVNQWLEGTKTNYGVGVYLTSSQESVSASYYTKRFYSRTSQYISKRPIIEARYDDSIQDDSATFYLSSALAPADDNINAIYLYNYVGGQLTNLPDVSTNKILVSIYSGTSSPTGSKLFFPKGGGASLGKLNTTGSYVSTGIYSASFAYASSSITTLFPVWHSGTTQYATGTAISVLTHSALSYRDFSDYAITPANLKATYTDSESTRIKLYVRPKDWTPTIYPKGNTTPSSSLLENLYYEVTRNTDGLRIIPYGTGSANDGFTRTSYDKEGNYFDLDLSQFEAGYKYKVSFVIKKDLSYIEQSDTIEFRVD